MERYFPKDDPYYKNAIIELNWDEHPAPGDEHKQIQKYQHKKDMRGINTIFLSIKKTNLFFLLFPRKDTGSPDDGVKIMRIVWNFKAKIKNRSAMRTCLADESTCNILMIIGVKL